MELKVKFLLLAGALVCSLGFMASCSSSDSTDDGNNWDWKPSSNFSGDPSEMKFAAVSGVARDAWSKPIGGVTVTSGTQTVTTDLNGFYQFNQVNVQNNHVLVSFSKDGYGSVVRSIAYEAGQPARLDVSLKESKTSSVNANSSSTITASSDYYGHQVQIDLEGGFTDNGATYTGSVTATTVYLDPDSYTFAEQMPGDLSAIRSADNGGGAVQLVSYGMVSVDFTGDNGQKLELAPGKQAKITFPIPNKFSGQTPPNEIPLWWFDEATGLWKEEGKATLNGNVYEGYVNHFTWWNLDSPELTAHLKVTVQDKNGNKLANVPIDIDGQRTFYTDSKGVMKCDIPSETKLYVRVASEAYGNYADFGGTEFKQEIQVGGDQTKTMTITIPARAPRIYGTVTNTGGSNVCALYIAYGGWQQTGSVMSDVNGLYSLYAPASFTGAAVLFARFADGSLIKKEIVITTEDQRIDLTVNAASGAGTGMFRVYSNQLGLNMSYALPAAQDGGLWTAEVQGGSFDISGEKELAKDETPMPEGLTPDEQWKWEEQHMQSGREQFNFYIQGYDPSKTEFESAIFSYYLEAGPHFQLHATGKATVTLNNGIYNIKMKGVSATFSDQMSGIDDNSKVTADIEFSAKKK